MHFCEKRKITPNFFFNFNYLFFGSFCFSADAASSFFHLQWVSKWSSCLKLAFIRPMYKVWDKNEMVKQTSPIVKKSFKQTSIKIVAAFQWVHVSPVKHSYGWQPRKCDYRTDRQTDGRWTKLSLLCRYASQATQKASHKSNTICFLSLTLISWTQWKHYSIRQNCIYSCIKYSAHCIIYKYIHCIFVRGNITR